MYERIVTNWLNPYIGAVEVSRLSPAIVQDAMERMRSDRLGPSKETVTGVLTKGRSSRSVQLAATVLKMATRWALRNELLGRDPLVGYRRPRSTSPSMTAWTADEARAFIAATRNERLGVGWALLLTRGLRRGELCGLRWSAVDLDARVLRVVATRVTIDGKATDSVPKTSAGLRSIPLDDALAGLVRSHWAKQAQERLVAGSAYADEGWVLADQLGKPYDPNIVTKWFRERAKELGLPAIRLHDTRHTAASLMLAEGTPVKVVSEVLGHASPTITLTTYAHVMPGMAEEAGERLSARLLG
jgi:integrase